MVEIGWNRILGGSSAEFITGFNNFDTGAFDRKSMIYGVGNAAASSIQLLLKY